MPDSHDDLPPNKKHRVIHWNPEDDESAVKKSNNGLKITVFALIFVIVVGALGVVSYLRNLEEERIAQAGTAEGQNAARSNIQERFISRSKADFAYDATRRKLEAARQMPTGHDVLRQDLINIEKSFLDAENLMKRSRYAEALEGLDAVNKQIDSFTALVNLKQTTQEMYNNFLSRIEELNRTKHLNEKAYEDAFAAASAGKQFLDEGSFKAAKTQLDEAWGKLDELDASIKDYLATNAALGRRYIVEGKEAEATEAFTNVLSIDPDNEDAIRNLERVKSAAEVYALLEQAKQKEDGGQLEAALVDYREAFALDPASARAQQGTSRVRRKIEDRDFNHHYSTASAAIAKKDYETAIHHFQEAFKIYPDRTDIQASITKAKKDKRQHDIVTMITKAYDYENAHNWQEARVIYQELLDIEPELKEAKDGMLRTGRMIRSILRYEKLVEVALEEARLMEYQSAIRTFDEAMKAKPAYLELDEETDRLRKYLQLQSSPVDIQFISDMNTWVSIQGPTQKKPRKIKEAVYSLLPGKYYVIGRKKGYEDVRFSLQVRAGKPQQPLTVICNIKRDN